VAIDLSLGLDLPVKLDARSPRLWFSRGLLSSEPQARTLEEMRDVLLDPSAKGPPKLYTMYRNVRLPGDEGILRSSGLRFDLTVIRSGFLGPEYIKTLGHYHPMIPGLGISYPEVYEVVHGGAWYLLQKVRSLADPRRVTDVVCIEARPGDRVVIPPNYGHVTINPYKTPLVMADVTAAGFSSIYSPFGRLGGAAYHLVLEKRRPTWLPNAKYIGNPEIRRARPSGLSKIGVPRSKATYRALIDNPGAFEFLSKPFRHKEFLDAVLG